MKRVKKVLVWAVLLNKRFLRRPLFLLLLALVPLLVAVVYTLPRENGSLIRVAVCAPGKEDKAADQAIRHLVSDRSPVVYYYRCSTKSQLKADVKSGKARLGYVFPEKLSALFDAYGSMDDTDVSSALAILGNVMGSGSKGLQKYAITVVCGSNDVVTKLAREQLYGMLFDDLEESVLLSWMDAHAADFPDSAKQRDAFLKKAMDDYRISYNFIRLSYLDGETIQDDQTGDYMSAPIRGLLCILLVLTAFASNLFLMQDIDSGRLVWMKQGRRALFHYFCHLVPVADAGIAVWLALSFSDTFLGVSKELPAYLLFLLCAVGFANLIRVLLRRMTLYSACLPIVLMGCLFLTPVFMDLVVFEPVQILLPPYLYLKSLHGAFPLRDLALYAGLTGVLSISLDRS